MKRFTRLYDDDLRDMVIEKYNLRPEQATIVFTEETRGYGPMEHTVPVFYIEIEESEE